MKLFLDASVVVAIVALENDFERYGEIVSDAEQCLTSGIARWEASRALARIDRMGGAEADRQIGDFLTQFKVDIVPIGEREAAFAIEAHVRYGKGNHFARLNMGDCFACACAKAHGAKLLYKGDDFARTDLA